jgi:hypothetical protein
VETSFNYCWTWLTSVIVLCSEEHCWLLNLQVRKCIKSVHLVPVLFKAYAKMYCILFIFSFNIYPKMFRPNEIFDELCLRCAQKRMHIVVKSYFSLIWTKTWTCWRTLGNFSLRITVFWDITPSGYRVSLYPRSKALHNHRYESFRFSVSGFMRARSAVRCVK